MLAYILALAVALSSLGIYLAAFFFPEIHRKNDFIWSGVGLFYALVLWVCARRITGGLLLGQVAGVALLGWSVTQTLQLRRQLTPSLQQTQLPSTAEVKNTVEKQISKLSLPQRLSQFGKRVGNSATTAKNRLQEQIPDTSLRSTSPATNTQAADTSVVSEAPTPPPVIESPKVQVIDNRTPIPQTIDTTATSPQTQDPPTVPPQTQETATSPQTQDRTEVALEMAQSEPTLTESEAISTAVENTLAEDTPAETAQPIRPHPPDPELVEAAIEDAQEKHIEAHPPETTDHLPPEPST